MQLSVVDFATMLCLQGDFVIESFTKREQKKGCSVCCVTDGLGQLGSRTAGMRAAICHGELKIMFTISIPNSKRINNAKVTISLFKDTSLRTKAQHFGRQRALRGV